MGEAVDDGRRPRLLHRHRRGLAGGPQRRLRGCEGARIFNLLLEQARVGALGGAGGRSSRLRRERAEGQCKHDYSHH
eukprot:4091070-Prymnesium_polylepis.3